MEVMFSLFKVFEGENKRAEGCPRIIFLSHNIITSRRRKDEITLGRREARRATFMYNTALLLSG